MNDLEREQIIEEEKLRWATRLTLLQEGHAGHGCGAWGHKRRAFRLLFLLPLIALAVWAVSHGACHF